MPPRRKKPRLSTESTDAANNSRSLFVRGLGPTTTTDDLTTHFSQSFPVKHAVAVLDQTKQQCRGYGFVTLADAEDAARAITELAGSELLGRKIQLELATARQREPGEEGNKALAEAKEEREKQRREQMQPAPKLIVRNLPWSIREPEQLSRLFLSFGKVKDVKLPKKKNGLLSGFGFVLLRGRKNAQKALEAINGKEVDGRTLAVDWAVDKEVWQAATKDADQDEAMEDAENGNEEDSDATSEDNEDGGAPLNDESEDDGASDGDDSEDVDMGDLDEPEDEEIEEKLSPPKRHTDNSATVFIRNLPFTCTDEDLAEHFSQFGDVRYARIVIDRGTERPKGTGFVCFKNVDTMETCLREAPKQSNDRSQNPSKATPHSILQDEELDSSGKFTMDGRVLNVTRAVDRSEADRLTAEGISQRNEKDKDKRHLYLLSEGTISTKSPLYQKLSPSEISMREASAKQRRNLIENNPSLHLSLTRLAIRNIPRSVTSKDLKSLAREAVVGFATDVKAGKRQALSKEELLRGHEEMKKAEQERKAKAKGIVKQAKVVFEGEKGGKVEESSGGGRSRGYGFIEYYTHRSALMGLRWLNGHVVEYSAKESQKKQAGNVPAEERKKRLIVEFAIENAQVVKRRSERETKFRDRAKNPDEVATQQPGSHGPTEPKKGASARTGAGKRKRSGNDGEDDAESHTSSGRSNKNGRIIAQKRKARREKKKASAA
jgi:nucleolar protein 4